MVSWWPGDGNTLDIQGGNNGSLQGGATFAPAEVGPGFSFNGTTAYVNVPDNANLYPSGSFTVDAWIKTSQTTGVQQIINHYECANFCPGGGANSDYEMTVTNGNLSGFIRDMTGANQMLTGTTAIADGTFHHVAMQRDIAGGQMRLYLDGRLEASATLIPIAPLQDEDGEPDPVTIGAIIQTNPLPDAAAPYSSSPASLTRWNTSAVLSLPPRSRRSPMLATRASVSRRLHQPPRQQRPHVHLLRPARQYPPTWSVGGELKTMPTTATARITARCKTVRPLPPARSRRPLASMA